jgi:hypothetical protein
MQNSHHKFANLARPCHKGNVNTVRHSQSLILNSLPSTAYPVCHVKLTDEAEDRDMCTLISELTQSLHLLL